MLSGTVWVRHSEGAVLGPSSVDGDGVQVKEGRKEGGSRTHMGQSPKRRRKGRVQGLSGQGGAQDSGQGCPHRFGTPSLLWISLCCVLSSSLSQL